MKQTAENMIEVFKTNITNNKQAVEITSLLLEILPGSIVNFDLEDCDKVLRIDHEMIQPAQVINLLRTKGVECSILQ